MTGESTQKIDRHTVKDDWIKRFELQQQALNGSNPESLAKISREAIDSFGSLGFPTTKNEEWKYTSVLPLLKMDFRPVVSNEAHSITNDQAEHYKIPGAEVDLLVFVNGFYAANLSDNKVNEGGIIVESLQTAKKNHSDIFEAHFSKHTDVKNTAFTALNTAIAQDGGFVFVPNGKHLERPVHILHLVDASNENVATNLRNLFIFEDNTEGTVIESTHTIGSQKGFTNTVTEIFAGNETRVQHHVPQIDNEHGHHIRRTQIVQGEKSHVGNTTITMGGAFIRNDLNFLHIGEHCESHLNGLYHLTDEMHVDNHTLVDHAVPNCYSNELYKGIMEDRSTGVFNGKVMVRQDAQKTNAFQSNKNIILSNDAQVNTKPQLEIYADDVKCSHGATTGRLDEEALFYLRARGVGEKAAKALLTFAFANDVLDQINFAPLKSFLESALAKKMGQDQILKIDNE